MLSKIDKKIKEWDDTETLENFMKFFDRVDIATQFVQNDDGLLVAQVLVFKSGDKIVISDPSELEWPLQPMPIPESFEGRLDS